MLHLSPSSMKYRMRIIRDLLGDQLLDHDSVFEIELALRLVKAFEGCGTAPSGVASQTREQRVGHAQNGHR